MLLLLTGSLDGTADRIISGLKQSAFRLNLDVIQDYVIEYSPTSWVIRNPSGLEVSSSNATRAFWWKAFSYGLQLDNLLLEESKYFFRELYSWFGYRNRIIGNPPWLENQIGKIRQLEIASKYFKVGETFLTVGKSAQGSSNKKYIVKSLTSGLTVSNRVMYTQEVDLKSLEPKLLWYVQEKFDSPEDITVLVFGKSVRVFSRSRENLEGLDWRKEQFNDPIKWSPVERSEDFELKIKEFCFEIGVEWGRIDFMKVDGDYVFLEMNMNGQWVFLDPDDKYGLLTEVINYIGTGATHNLSQFRP